MKKSFIALVVFLAVSPIFSSETPKDCTTCAGVVSDLSAVPPSPLPLLVLTSRDQLPAVTAYLSTLSAEQRARTTVVVEAAPAAGTIDAIDSDIAAIAAALQPAAPLAGAGVHFGGLDPALVAYATKRFAVEIQGNRIAAKLVAAPASQDELKQLYEAGAQAYFDILLTSEDPAAAVTWLAERDPVKRVAAVVQTSHVNALYDAAVTLKGGATTAYLQSPNDPQLLASIAEIDRQFAGDYAPDDANAPDILDRNGAKSTARAIAFVRGEDLRTVIVPEGSSDVTIVSLNGDEFTKPRRADAAGTRDITDAGKKGGRTLIGVQPSAQPYAILVDRVIPSDEKMTKETINVASTKTLPVEEIVRNHQAYWNHVTETQPRYVAKNETKLRFEIAEGGQSIEATLAGDHFFDRSGTNDWVWTDLLLNGVKWKYGRIPELPLIQPEKVTQLPLDIHLTNDYRYDLVRETPVRGFDTYEVRFNPPADAPATLPLYRGTVWIDKRTWARTRISMVQLNLKGEVLSNEERVDYQPFDRATHAPLSAAETAKHEPSTILWLPSDVNAEQVLSTAGRSTVVLRATDFSNFRIDPDDFEALHQAASASTARMVRDTDRGLRYLEKTSSGERVVQENADTSRLFLLGGIHHDDGLDFPVVPLGGIDYFNYDLGGRKLQANVFYAGIVLAANVTDPSFRGTRTNVGADFFGIGIATTDTQYRNGGEAKSENVKDLPAHLNLQIGHPVLGFGKVDFRIGISHDTYQRAEDTASDFQVPSDTFEITPSLNLRYDRWGYSMIGWGEHGTRTTWKPWGYAGDYDPSQKSFTRFGGTISKSFYLPDFQRLGLELDYMDGQHLDRFSKYQFGFFGANRVRGVKSGSLRAERAITGHVSYGFVFSQQFRLEAFYDHALVDDKASGFRREPFQGVGIGGQTVGPWGTILRLDLGKTIGKNSQDGFVADIVLLKLFG